MPQIHIVKRGETLSHIAAKYGFGGDWHALYQAPENAALRQKRPNVTRIQPGDHVVIPDRTAPQAQRSPADDLIQRARRLNGEYLGLRDRYMAWVSNRDRAGWYSIAEWTQALATQDADKYGSRINKSALRGFLEGYEREAGQQRRLYESKCNELVTLMLSQAFRRQFDALAGDEQAECYADLTEGFNESHVGRTFILQELQKAERNEPTALLTGVFKVTKEANGAFWKFLAEFSPVIVLWKQEQARAYVERLIIQRVRLVSVDMLRRQVNLYQATTIVRVRQEFMVTVLTPERIRLTETANLQRVSGLMNKAFEAFNLAFALNEARKKLGPKEMLSTVGALAGMLEQFKTVTTALTARKFMRVAGAGTEASVLAIVTGVCDAVTGSMDAWDRYSRGDYDAMVVYGAGAAGGAAAAVGASLIVFGAGTSWTGVGVVVLLVGAVVSVAAAIASVFGGFEDSPVQLWLANNRFGNRGNSPAPEFRGWRGSYTRQLEALEKALATVEFSGDFSEDGHQLVLKPSLVLTCSRVLVSIRASWNLGTYQYWRDQPLDNHRDVKVEGSRVTEIKINVPRPPGHRGEVLYTSIRVDLTVDVYNDGSTMKYTRTATLTPSMMERLFSWF